MKQHYHVLAGFHGCLAESNDVYKTKNEARLGLKEIVSQLRDSRNRLRGNLKDGYFEIIKKTDALCDYVNIETCHEEECLKSLESEY